MGLWRRVLRIALVVFIVGVGATVALSLRERARPAQAVVVERADPAAVIQTRGSRIVQDDGVGETLRIVANRQLTYPDGTLRMIDGVEVTVPMRHEREGFTLTADEASVGADETQVDVSGGVEMQSSTGLRATTDVASYFDVKGLVTMPDQATFVQEGMHAEGKGAEYDRDRDLLRLLTNARVRLTAGTAMTRITSDTGIVAQTDGYMQFDGAVLIDAGSRLMEAERARAEFVDTVSHLEMLELDGGARVRGTQGDAGQLREMSARGITMTYGETGTRIDRATLTTAARLLLNAADGAEGAEIRSRSMDIQFESEGDGVSRLSARDGVRLRLPATSTQPAQRVRADTLTTTQSGGGNGLDRATFEGSVEYLETRTDRDANRVVRAERLEAALAGGLTAVETARFFGTVSLDDDGVEGEADEAAYRVDEGVFELLTVGPAGQTPRVVDDRGSVQAETVRVLLDGPSIEATGGVESVLSGASENGDEDPNTPETGKRPRLLEAAEPVLVTANHLVYDRARQQATYTGRAHLWQGETEFHGDQIVLDEATGNLSATGSVRTRSLLTQVNDETGEPEQGVTTGRAEQVVYDDESRRVTYTTDALVKGPRGDLSADTVTVFLQPESQTLERLEAAGGVRLETPGRLLVGTGLVYHDADGRYEMRGQPVRIVEELDDECRETTGRTLTFFLTGDELSVDGQAEVRTQTASGRCLEFK